MLLLAPAASAADQWVRWVSAKPDAWVRSLDFTTPVQLYAGTEGDGVFSANLVAGPWSTFNGGLDTAQSKALGRSSPTAPTSGPRRPRASSRARAAAPGSRSLRARAGPAYMGGIQAILFNSPGDILVGVASSGVWYWGNGGWLMVQGLRVCRWRSRSST